MAHPTHFVAELLAPEGETEWLALTTSDRRNDRAQAESLRRDLKLGTDAPTWRFVARDADARQKIVARLRATVDSDRRLNLGTPQVYSDGRNARVAILNAVAAQVISTATRTQPAIKAVEAQPGPDVDHYEEWSEALRSAGYRLVCEYSTYECNIASLRENAAGMTFSNVDPSRWTMLEALYERCTSSTLDRRDIDLPEFAPTYLRKLRDLGTQSSPWIVGFVEGKPTGYALTSCEAVVGADPPTTWLLELGVDPAVRRLGYGTALVVEALRAVHSHGGHTCKVAVDDTNVPALRIVDNLNFRKLVGGYLVFRFHI